MNFMCGICRERLTEPVALPCGHTCDKECIDRWVLTRATCPECREAIVAPGNLRVNIALRDSLRLRRPAPVPRRS